MLAIHNPSLTVMPIVAMFMIFSNGFYVSNSQPKPHPWRHACVVYDILQWILFFSKSQRAFSYLFAKLRISERNTKTFLQFSERRHMRMKILSYLCPVRMSPVGAMVHMLLTADRIWSFITSHSGMSNTRGGICSSASSK